jgi:hypothetical protein
VRHRPLNRRQINGGWPPNKRINLTRKSAYLDSSGRRARRLCA